MQSGQDKKDSHNLPLMFMKLTNDNTACFCKNPDFKKMEFSFEFKRYCFPSTDETLCFEADITENLQSSFREHGVNIDEYESKLYFALMADGTLGRVLKRKISV